jgi:hypothetical protein
MQKWSLKYDDKFGADIFLEFLFLLIYYIYGDRCYKFLME